jgi:hypothetical protein
LDPRISIYLNLLCVALVGVGGYLVTNTAFMGTHAGMITALVISCAIAGINAILHAVPSKPGATEQFPLGPK